MFTHRQMWAAIDGLAERYGYSVSGLAKAAGLDTTSFNKSKRFTKDGRPRWPSTESLTKILSASGANLEEFSALVGQKDGSSEPPVQQPIPLIGFAQAGKDGFFDDGGFPVGGGWDQIHFPDIHDENAYMLEVKGESMAPLYRAGDRLIVSPNADVRRGDRVVLKTLDGEILAKILHRKTATKIELESFNPLHPLLVYGLDEIEWVARIVWASQ